MKAILRFIIITLVASLGLAMIGVLYLFFIPNATLFGIDYISLNYVQYSEAYSAEKIETIDFSSLGYKVTVVPVNSENISAKVYANTLGFVKKKNSAVKIDGTIAGSVLDLNVSEPSGFAWKNDSYIELYVPQNKNFNLILNNKSSRTYMSKEALKLNKLTYTTNSGNIYLSNITINNDIELNLAKAKCYIEDNVKLNKNNINLTFSSGDLIAKSSNFSVVNISKNKGGTVNFNSCDSFTAKVNAGGRYTIGTVGTVNIVSEDTNIDIGTITEGCLIHLKKSGRVNIANLNCSAASIQTDTGNIVVENVYEKVRLESDEGDIVVKNATKLITAVNKYGNINITFNEEVAPYNTTNECRAVDITNENGKVDVVGAENVKIIVGNKGRINVQMRNVVLGSKIDGNLGYISVVVNKDAKFNLNVGGTTGEIRVNFLEFEQSGGYTEHNLPDGPIEINGGSAKNILTITNKKGDIKIVDTGLAG